MQAKARLIRVEADYQRAQTLIQTAAIAKADFDLALGDRNEASAMVRVAEAALNTAALNLGFTKVTAPISGRISRQNIDPGNMVVADTTILTTIVSLDPMYAYFDVDEAGHAAVPPPDGGRKGEIRPRGEVAGLPRAGRRGRQVSRTRARSISSTTGSNPSTGTLRLRGRFDNHTQVPLPRHVRADPGAHRPDLIRRSWPRSGPSAPTRTRSSSTCSTTRTRSSIARSQIGAFQNGLRVIESGLAPGERFIINGLQRVKPGTPSSRSSRADRFGEDRRADAAGQWPRDTPSSSRPASFRRAKGRGKLAAGRRAGPVADGTGMTLAKGLARQTGLRMSAY